MAGLALRGKPRLCVIRVVRSVEIGHVAAIAIRRSALKFASDVAGRAFQRRVRSREREACKFQVIEFRVVPRIEPMARLAGAGKIQLSVAWIDGLLEIGRVTRNTCGR